MFDVCVVGQVTKDIVKTADDEIEKPGGTAYYTAIALKKLGMSVAVITKLRRRLPAHQPPRRFVQDASVGPGSLRRRSGGDRLQAGHGGSHRRANRRGGSRRVVPVRRSHPLSSASETPMAVSSPWEVG